MKVIQKRLSWLHEITGDTRYNFKIELCGENNESCHETLICQELMAAFIGKEQPGYQADAYYDLLTHQLRPDYFGMRFQQIKQINCFSKGNVMSAADFIRGITFLAEKASEHNKILIVYADIHIPDEKYRDSALIYKAMNSYLNDKNGTLIIKTPENKRRTLKNIFYTRDSFTEVIKKVNLISCTSIDYGEIKDFYEEVNRNGELYNDVFYNCIPNEQNIYVVLYYGNYKPEAYYEEMGVHAVELAEDYKILYASKKIFDENSKALRSEVTPQYQMPILSYCTHGVQAADAQPRSLLKDRLTHNGKGVYIGIVGTEGVNYMHKALRTKAGKTRIACIWEQTEAGEGKYYFEEEINRAIESDDPEKIVPILESDGILTMMLGIAGGEDSDSGYYGMAGEAEFLVAKINTASEALQKIYGGMPNKQAALMPDLLVGFAKLRAFAKSQGKPLVFCFPFNTNVCAHEATFIPNDIVSYIGKQPGITITAPAGEEADKMHHYSISGKQKKTEKLILKVKKQNQNIVGMICQKVITIQSVTLFSPENIKTEFVNLQEGGIRKLEQNTVVYSNGTHINFLNGTIETLFRIENPSVGDWKAEIQLDPEIDSLIDVWISQQELNDAIAFSPSDPLKTIGSTACIDIIGVGAYEKESMVVTKDSGRGYNWNEQIRPRLVTHAKNITAPYKQSEWANLSGTLAAVSIITGAAADLYSKFITEHISPLPNTMVIDSIMLSMLKQLGDIHYPNPSQGYGIFDMDSLAKLLASSINL